MRLSFGGNSGGAIQHTLFSFSRACLLGLFVSAVAGAATFPDGRIRSISGSSTTLHGAIAGRWSVVIAAAAAPDGDSLVFPNALVSHFKEQKLIFAYVLPSGAPAAPARDVLARNITFIEALDAALLRRLGITDTIRWGTYLVAPDLTVRFHAAGLIGDDLLRQLCERNLLGQAEYDWSSDTPGLAPGAALPDVTVCSPDGRRARLCDVVRPGGTLVFIAAYCAPCTAKNYLDRIAGIRAGILRGRNLVILFSRTTPSGVFSQLAGAPGLTGISFRAEMPVPGWEDVYHTSPLEPAVTPKVIGIGSEGKIETVQPIPDWFAAM